MFDLDVNVPGSIYYSFAFYSFLAYVWISVATGLVAISLLRKPQVRHIPLSTAYM